MSRNTSFLSLVAAILLPILAFAEDGQTLIDQKVVMAAGGFPYTITQPGSYKLSGNLVVPSGRDGIEIKASQVTLDLNGFTIEGSSGRVGGNNGINAGILVPLGVEESAYPANITIRNGVVTQFGGNGVIAIGNGTIIDSVIATTNGLANNADGNGIHIENGILRNSTSQGNGLGIYAVNAQVMHNSVYTNVQGGITAVNSYLLDNAATYNVIGPGISAYGSFINGNFAGYNDNLLQDCTYQIINPFGPCYFKNPVYYYTDIAGDAKSITTDDSGVTQPSSIDWKTVLKDTITVVKTVYSLAKL